MSQPARRWWGWAEPRRPPHLPAAGLAMLSAEIGLAPDARGARVSIEEVELPDRSLPAPVAEALRAAVGAENVRADRADRVTHAAGKSYPDLMRLRS
ncbi:MAG: alkyldihydroxyacetonephosphate synthase, partial [Thermoleophilaceae bacterium]|nr:alkyldihydroxyacetonephosphate synthase [Thermoleophilaceae bacterium]